MIPCPEPACCGAPMVEFHLLDAVAVAAESLVYDIRERRDTHLHKSLAAAERALADLHKHRDIRSAT